MEPVSYSFATRFPALANKYGMPAAEIAADPFNSEFVIGAVPAVFEFQPGDRPRVFA
jgi:hypothetical protein